MMRKVVRENLGTMKSGQELVVVGFVGVAGTRVIASERRDLLTTWFSDEYLDMILEIQEPEYGQSFREWNSFGATECEPSGEGGILKTLWDLSGAYETGITFNLRKIPIRQETIEICERVECNPYRLYSNGCYLLVGDNGNQLVEALAGEGIPAAVIGTVNSTIAREILSAEGRGFLERPQPDELGKVVLDYVFI